MIYIGTLRKESITPVTNKHSVNIVKTPNRQTAIIDNITNAVFIRLNCLEKSFKAIALVNSLRSPLLIPKSPKLAHEEIEAIVAHSP